MNLWDEKWKYMSEEEKEIYTLEYREKKRMRVVREKHVAHAGYMRNHRLINEKHKKKLEAELTTIEEKFEWKKRKFQESSDEFLLEIKKHGVYAVLPDFHRKLVREKYQNMVGERKRMRVVREEERKEDESTKEQEDSAEELLDNELAGLN